MEKSFAIIIACYNRIDGVQKLVESLEKVDFANRGDVTLIFSIDNSGNDDVEEFAKRYDWPFGQKKIRTFRQKQGLKEHIIQCGDFAEEYDIIAVLEDDVKVSNSMYRYAYDAALFYWDDENIAGISLYNYQKNWLDWTLRFEPQKREEDVYFMKIAQSWGEVWTRPQWQRFKKWYNSNKIFVNDDKLPSVLNEWGDKSWLKFFCRYCIEENKYFVYPYYGMSTNSSAAGEHSARSTSDYEVELQFDKKKFLFDVFDRKTSIIYDEYMNREELAQYLGLNNEDVNIDLYQTRSHNDAKYLLTTNKISSMPPIRSFSLTFRPIELNIILENKGENIFLYKNNQQKPGNAKKNKNQLYEYSLRIQDRRKLFNVCLSLLRTAARKTLRIIK